MMIALRILLLLLLFIFAGYSLTISAAQDATGGHGLNFIGGVKENGLSIIGVRDDYEDFVDKVPRKLGLGGRQGSFVAAASSAYDAEMGRYFVSSTKMVGRKPQHFVEVVDAVTGELRKSIALNWALFGLEWDISGRQLLGIATVHGAVEAEEAANGFSKMSNV